MKSTKILAILLLVTAAAQADVVFNNFGPADEYHPQWYTSVAYDPDWDLMGEEYDVDTAMAFTPTGGGYYLDKIELALSIRGGNNEIDVWLMNDNGGQPGSIIEAIHLSGAVPGYPGVYPPVVAISQSNPRLDEGVRYWIVVSASGPSNTSIDWHYNTVGYNGLGAQRQLLDGIGDWNVSPTGGTSTFRVTVTVAKVIYVDTDAAGGNNGSSWTNAYNHLQDALAVAGPGDEIRVAEGVYKPDQGGGNTPGDPDATFRLIDTVTIKGGYAGVGEPNPNARDIEACETVLSGDLKGNDGPDFTNNDDNSYNVVTCVISGGEAMLDGFTITAGNAVGLSPTSQGGGIYIGAGSPTLINCTFIYNKAARGGAVSNSNYFTDDPAFISCKFLGNSAGVGGAMESQGGAPTLTNCIFSGNVTTSSGATLFNMGYSNVTLTNCTLSANTAEGSGGGIYNSWETATVELINCILWGNSDGGGMDESAQIHNVDGDVVVNYSCIQQWSGSGGIGNIGDDPLFVDANGPDDIVGTEDDNVRLSFGSPCIDTGHPGPEYQDPDGTRNDMGAYGGPWGSVSAAGTHAGTGFIFTSIGNIPFSEIVQDSHDPSHGLVKVASASVANELGIPQYTDSPFGRTLWIHGLFGDYDNVDYYQILVGRWDDGNEPAMEDYVALRQSLTKVEYFIDPCDGTWTYRYVNLGPKTIDEIDNLYKLTDSGYWSHIDLRVRWNTAVYENGKYTLTHKAYQDTGGGNLIEVTQQIPIDLVLIVDNSAVTAVIHNVKYDTGEEIPECGIINLAADTENLKFNITAWHPNGYLHRYILDAIYGKNRYAGVIASDSYSLASPLYWYGVQQQEFQSEDGSQDPWQQCAYQFRLRASSRATNGYHYVISKEFNDHYYLNLGLDFCGGADIDRSGKVDFHDLAELAKHWLETSGP